MIINLLPRPVRFQSHKDGRTRHEILLPYKGDIRLETKCIDSSLLLEDGSSIRITREVSLSSLPPKQQGVFYLTTFEKQQILKRSDVISIGRQLKSLVTSFIFNY